MNRFVNISNPLTWLMLLLLSAFVAGCSGGSSTAPLSSAKAITAYSLAGNAGTINEVNYTIAVTVPFATSVTAQVATFTTTGTSVKIGTAVQTSGTTSNSFTAPVAYIVTAADGSTVTYTVTVTVAANTAKAITAFSFVGFAGNPGVITQGTTPKTIAVTLPFGTPVTALTATFTTTGASVKIGTVVQNSGAAPTNSFAAPKVYTVTAADASTADYTVTVTLAQNTAKAITTFSFVGFTGNPGVITGAASPFAIAVTLPLGTPVTALTATFTTTGASVKIGTVVQNSGAAPTNDFTVAKAYIVTAADGTTATYNVTVTLGSVVCTGTGCVNLGTSANYVIFSNSAIATSVTPNPSVITGNIAVGPGVTSSALTGFSETLPAGSAFSTSAQVSGKLFAADYAAPSSADVNTASLDMGTASVDAAGRATAGGGLAGGVPGVACPSAVTPGALGGVTLTPGVYTCTVALSIATGTTLTLSGAGVYIIKTTQTLDQAASTNVILTNGALPQNVFWQVAGAVNIGANAHFEGIILGDTAITLGNLASIKGRLLAKTGVTLDQSTVTQP